MASGFRGATSLSFQSLSEPQNSPSPLFFQLRVHVEFLPNLFPAADVSGICVRDLFLREGESSSHLSSPSSSSLPSSALIGAPPRSPGVTLGIGVHEAGAPLLTGIGSRLDGRGCSVSGGLVVSAILICLCKSLQREDHVAASPVCPLGIRWDIGRAPHTKPSMEQWSLDI